VPIDSEALLILDDFLLDGQRPFILKNTNGIRKVYPVFFVVEIGFLRIPLIVYD
jgi:hypothetical protein